MIIPASLHQVPRKEKPKSTELRRFEVRALEASRKHAESSPPLRPRHDSINTREFFRLSGLGPRTQSQLPLQSGSMKWKTLVAVGGSDRASEFRSCSLYHRHSSANPRHTALQDSKPLIPIPYLLAKSDLLADILHVDLAVHSTSREV